jgi:hypothetical protein
MGRAEAYDSTTNACTGILPRPHSSPQSPPVHFDSQAEVRPSLRCDPAARTTSQDAPARDQVEPPCQGTRTRCDCRLGSSTADSVRTVGVEQCEGVPRGAEWRGRSGDWSGEGEEVEETRAEGSREVVQCDRSGSGRTGQGCEGGEEETEGTGESGWKCRDYYGCRVDGGSWDDQVEATQYPRRTRTCGRM